jgi:hypothetical protein
MSGMFAFIAVKIAMSEVRIPLKQKEEEENISSGCATKKEVDIALAQVQRSAD